MDDVEDAPSHMEFEDRWNWLPSRTLPLGEETQCHIPSTTKRWRKVSSSGESSSNPEGRCSHTLTALSDECLLLVGGGCIPEGEDTFQHFGDVWVLNALTAKWGQFEPKVRPSKDQEDPESYWGMTFGPSRRGHVAAAYQNKYLIVFGGIADGDVLLNDLWVLNVPLRQWKRIKADGGVVPSPRRGGVACVYKNYFHIIGGHESEQMVVWKLGPLSSSDSWRWSIQSALNDTFLHKRAPKWPAISLGARPLQPIQFTASAIVGNKLWIYGGLERLQDMMVPTTLLYRLDMDAWEWTILYCPKHAPCPRSFHGMTSIGRFLVIMGGIGCISEQDEVTDVAEEDNNDGPVRQSTIFDLFYFDTDALAWEQEQPSSYQEEWPCARNAFGLARLGNHHLVVFGGGVYQQNYFSDTFALEFELPVAQAKQQQEDDLLSSDLGQLYKSGLLSDVTLLVGSRHFPVHKAILAARCEFFETMFAGPYSESIADEVRFDALPDAVDFVLQFLYTNHVDTNPILGDADLVSSILCLVDFWGVQKLLEILEVALGKELRTECADPLELIAFAKVHNCKRLALQCLDFCKQRFASIKLDDADPDIAAEIRDYANSLL